MDETPETKDAARENAGDRAWGAAIWGAKVRERLSRASVAIAIVIAVTVGLAAAGYALYDANQKAVAHAEERAAAVAFNGYVDHLNATAEYFMDGEDKAEEAGSLVANVWSAAANNPYGDWDDDLAPYQSADPHEALSKLLASDKYGELLSGMESAEGFIDDSFKQLASPPQGCEEAYDTLKKMCVQYKAMCKMVRNPSGALHEYRDNFEGADKELNTLSKLLKSQIPDKMEVPA